MLPLHGQPNPYIQQTPHLLSWYHHTSRYDVYVFIPSQSGPIMANESTFGNERLSPKRLNFKGLCNVNVWVIMRRLWPPRMPDRGILLPQCQLPFLEFPIGGFVTDRPHSKYYGSSSQWWLPCHCDRFGCNLDMNSRHVLRLILHAEWKHSDPALCSVCCSQSSQKIHFGMST